MTPIDADENTEQIGIDEFFDFLILLSISPRISSSSSAHLGVIGGRFSVVLDTLSLVGRAPSSLDRLNQGEQVHFNGLSNVVER